MNTLRQFITRSLIGLLILSEVRGQGFTDSHITFYGEVRSKSGAKMSLLQSGNLEVTFVSQSETENRVRLSTTLRPMGPGSSKPYSYSLAVPLAYLPTNSRLGDYLSIKESSTNFQIEEIKVNGQDATLLDGSKDFFELSFANRAQQYRLDLLSANSSTDSDGDRLPDWWEMTYDLDPNASDSNQDYDSDGWSNYDEFVRGSDPRTSNIDPELATMEILVPELGQAGCLIEFHDSNSSPEEISVNVDLSLIDAFTLQLDNTSLPENQVTLTASDLKSGRLTILNKDPSTRLTPFPVTWTDGGRDRSGTINLTISSPSLTNGTDAALWLDAHSLSSGNLVSQWIDRSGNNRNALQPLSNHQPVVKSEDPRKGVSFERKTSHLFFDDVSIPAGEHTVLATWASPSSSDKTQFILSSNRGFFRLEPTATAVSYPGVPIYQSDSLAVQGFESSPGETSTSIFRKGKSNLLNIFGLSHNGQEIATENIDPVLPTIGAKRLAIPVEDPVRQSFEGTLYEMLIFPRALSEQKLRDVHDYLQSKWNGYVIWDYSRDLRSIELTGISRGKNILRGGHGDDKLGGGKGETIISGGPGSDTLFGGKGLDVFVFGEIDTGDDQIINFDLEQDSIDLSALFWGKTGDARHYLTSRLDTSFENATPSLDTTLVILRPDDSRQEITLKNIILTDQKIIQFIMEGRIKMGGLTIPTEVTMALVSDTTFDSSLSESRDSSFVVEVTRTGEGTAGSLEVPLGISGEILGKDLILEGIAQKEGQRATITFERGETTKTIAFRPMPDLESEGQEKLIASILPHYRYSVSGGPVIQSIDDDPIISLMVLEPNALTSGQKARVRIIREGNLDAPLTVNLELEGTAVEGVHLAPLSRTVTIPAAKKETEIAIATATDWVAKRDRMALLRLSPGEDYQIGSPHEATIYVSENESNPETSGFDYWLSAATEGQFKSIVELLQGGSREELNRFIYSYATGLSANASNRTGSISFRLVKNGPELSTPLSRSAADIGWQVQNADHDNQWHDVSGDFSEEINDEGIILLGPPRGESDHKNLYRLAFTLEQNIGFKSLIKNLTSSERYGLSGTTSWQTDSLSGHLTSLASAAAHPQRIIVEIDRPTLLDFEMSMDDAASSDTFSFYVNGVKKATTSGKPIKYKRLINSEKPVLLMWEYRGSKGRAIIKNQGNPSTN